MRLVVLSLACLSFAGYVSARRIAQNPKPADEEDEAERPGPQRGNSFQAANSFFSNVAVHGPDSDEEEIPVSYIDNPMRKEPVEDEKREMRTQMPASAAENVPEPAAQGPDSYNTAQSFFSKVAEHGESDSVGSQGDRYSAKTQSSQTEDSLPWDGMVSQVKAFFSGVTDFFGELESRGESSETSLHLHDALSNMIQSTSDLVGELDYISRSREPQRSEKSQKSDRPQKSKKPQKSEKRSRHRARVESLLRDTSSKGGQRAHLEADPVENLESLGTSDKDQKSPQMKAPQVEEQVVARSKGDPFLQMSLTVTGLIDFYELLTEMGCTLKELQDLPPDELDPFIEATGMDSKQASKFKNMCQGR